MKTNRNIENKVNSTLGVIDHIKDVNVSPFFKEKALQRLFIEKKEPDSLWSRFTPELQFGVLICVIVLNILAISSINEETYNNDLTEFAENFGLSEEQVEASLLD